MPTKDTRTKGELEDHADHGVKSHDLHKDRKVRHFHGPAGMSLCCKTGALRTPPVEEPRKE